MQDFYARWWTTPPVQSCYSVPKVEKKSGLGLARKQSRFEPHRKFMDCFEGQNVWKTNSKGHGRAKSNQNSLGAWYQLNTAEVKLKENQQNTDFSDNSESNTCALYVETPCYSWCSLILYMHTESMSFLTSKYAICCLNQNFEGCY